MLLIVCEAAWACGVLTCRHHELHEKWHESKHAPSACAPAMCANQPAEYRTRQGKRQKKIACLPPDVAKRKAIKKRAFILSFAPLENQDGNFKRREGT